jgi:hypothetical protein
MQVVGMALEDDVAPIPASVAVVLVIQRLVQVTDEVHDVLQGLGLRCPVCVGVSQDGEKLLSLGDHAIAVGAFPRQVDLRICQRDVDVVPVASLAVVPPILVGPARQGVDAGAVEEITGQGECKGVMKRLAIIGRPATLMSQPACQ